ncbi:MAG: AMP-binding protein, partial [Dehalococcoidia bacterium]|nr:AMP-binding protein [Dehalococcoidia bacterium]
DWDNIALLWKRRFRTQGIKEGDIAQVAFAYTLFIVGFSATEGLMRAGALVIPAGSGAVTSSERQLEIARNWGTTVFCCTGSYMLHLANVAEQAGMDPGKDFKIRISIHAAEPLTESMRREIQSRWHCKTYDTYGSVETSAPMYECQFQNGHHINEDAYIYEILNPETGEEAMPGEDGEVVATTLFKEAAPLVRYKIGDIAGFLPGNCQCGSNFVRMSKVKGRIDEMMKVKGVGLYPTDFEAALKKFQVFGSEYLIVINRENSPDTVKLRVEHTGDNEATDFYKQDLIRELRSKLGLGCEVELLPKGALDKELNVEERIKYKRVLDLRKKED